MVLGQYHGDLVPFLRVTSSNGRRFRLERGDDIQSAPRVLSRVLLSLDSQHIELLGTRY